jgi:hypothetical protein
MHGCEVLFIGFFLKLRNDRYKLEVSTSGFGRKSMGKKIETPKGLYLLGNMAGQNALHHKPPKFLMDKAKIQGHITEHHNPPLMNNNKEVCPLVNKPPTMQKVAANEKANNILAELSMEK